VTKNDFCVTGFDWSLHFKWIPLSSEQKAQHSDPTEPFLWVFNAASVHQKLLLHQITGTCDTAHTTCSAPGCLLSHDAQSTKHSLTNSI